MKDFIPHISITVIVIVVAILVATYFSKEAVFKRDFISIANAKDNITSVEANYGNDKVRISAKYVRDILRNINLEDKSNFHSEDVPIAIVIYIKGKLMGGLTFYISRSGWGYDPLNIKYNRFYDRELGEQYYNTILALIKKKKE